MMKSSLLLILVIAGSASAKDLGTWGDLYPMQEQDVPIFIQQRLKSMEVDGSLAREQNAVQGRVKAHILRPLPGYGLRLANKNETHYIDLTFIVDKDVADGQGGVFAYTARALSSLIKTTKLILWSICYSGKHFTSSTVTITVRLTG